MNRKRDRACHPTQLTQTALHTCHCLNLLLQELKVANADNRRYNKCYPQPVDGRSILEVKIAHLQAFAATQDKHTTTEVTTAITKSVMSPRTSNSNTSSC
jgi:hypothetical protein